MNKLIYESFESTKYITIYLKIISNSLSSNRILHKKSHKEYIYYENHHILPKSLFKEYKDLKTHKWNKSLLTPREHFICHILLMKHYRKLNDKNAHIRMSRALHRLSSDRTHNSKIYTLLKLNLSHTEETKQKISKINTGRKHTDKTKQMWSNQRKGVPKSEECKSNMRKPKSAEHAKNISLCQINIIKVYNAKDELMYCNVDENGVKIKFSELCKLLNLPTILGRSHLNNGRRLYLTKNGEAQAIKNKTIQFKGWYAIKCN